MDETYILRSSAIASRALGGETMVMSVVDSTFFTLNEVASAIWQAADGKTPLTEIISNSVCPRFEIDSATAFADAEQFVKELSQHGILVVSGKPIAPEGK